VPNCLHAQRRRRHRRRQKCVCIGGKWQTTADLYKKKYSISRLRRTYLHSLSGSARHLVSLVDSIFRTFSTPLITFLLSALFSPHKRRAVVTRHREAERHVYIDCKRCLILIKKKVKTSSCCQSWGLRRYLRPSFGLMDGPVCVSRLIFHIYVQFRPLNRYVAYLFPEQLATAPPLHVQIKTSGL
jgi:hypothetical protein